MKLDNLEIQWLGHDAFRIKAGGNIIYIDPFKIQEEKGDADLVLITHPHYDHCSLEDLGKVVREGTTIVMPADCQSKIARVKKNVKMVSVKVGDKLKVGVVQIEAVRAYNTNKQFHPRSQDWIGFVFSVGGKKIYHAGDTDLIPEMQELREKEIDVALLPVSGIYVMTAEEAVKAAEIIKAKVSVPMHYSSIVGTEEDADKFVKLCREKGLDAEKIGKS